MRKLILILLMAIGFGMADQIPKWKIFVASTDVDEYNVWTNYADDSYYMAYDFKVTENFLYIDYISTKCQCPKKEMLDLQKITFHIHRI